jgi:hypothetical protein
MDSEAEEAELADSESTERCMMGRRGLLVGILSDRESSPGHGTSPGAASESACFRASASSFVLVLKLESPENKFVVNNNNPPVGWATAKSTFF